MLHNAQTWPAGERWVLAPDARPATRDQYSTVPKQPVLRSTASAAGDLIVR
jgi:hypothetical protein